MQRLRRRRRWGQLERVIRPLRQCVCSWPRPFASTPTGEGCTRAHDPTSLLQEHQDVGRHIGDVEGAVQSAGEVVHRVLELVLGSVFHISNTPREHRTHRLWQARSCTLDYVFTFFDKAFVAALHAAAPQIRAEKTMARKA